MSEGGGISKFAPHVRENAKFEKGGFGVLKVQRGR